MAETSGISEIKVAANGVRFVCLHAGDPSGPLALCLHGFPDTAHTWRHLLPRLAEAGYHAVAPFMRGYAPTEVPADGRYQSGVLGVDANALHEALGGDDRAVLVGHDWGAAGVYAAATLEPSRWRKVVAMSVPTANAVPVAFLTQPQQLKLSWYMFFFQSHPHIRPRHAAEPVPRQINFHSGHITSYGVRSAEWTCE